jgi:hypothetical protein
MPPDEPLWTESTDLDTQLPAEATGQRQYTTFPWSPLDKSLKTWVLSAAEGCSKFIYPIGYNALSKTKNSQNLPFRGMKIPCCQGQIISEWTSYNHCYHGPTEVQVARQFL